MKYLALAVLSLLRFSPSLGFPGRMHKVTAALTVDSKHFYGPVKIKRERERAGAFSQTRLALSCHDEIPVDVPREAVELVAFSFAPYTQRLYGLSHQVR